MSDNGKPLGTIRRGVEVLWEEPPNHFDAFSKMLVRPENADTKLFDFRISSYQPKGYVAPHIHNAQEQIYYIISGEALVEIDGARTPVDPYTVIHFPPGVEHALYNTGMTDLTFVVVTTPPDDVDE